MPRSVFARQSRPLPTETQPQIRERPPSLQPLERPPLSAARGVVLAVALGALVWAVGAALYWVL